MYVPHLFKVWEHGKMLSISFLHRTPNASSSTYLVEATLSGFPRGFNSKKSVSEMFCHSRPNFSENLVDIDLVGEDWALWRDEATWGNRRNWRIWTISIKSMPNCLSLTFLAGRTTADSIRLCSHAEPSRVHIACLPCLYRSSCRILFFLRT